MKKISIENLRGSHIVTVDDEDYWLMQQYMWSINTGGYVYCKKLTKYLHQIINHTPKGYHTDHINRDKLDNRRCNLRTATVSENILNSSISKNNKSGYNGVDYRVKAGSWRARITKNRKEILIGHFNTREEAIEARKSVETQYGVPTQ